VEHHPHRVSHQFSAHGSIQPRYRDANPIRSRYTRSTQTRPSQPGILRILDGLPHRMDSSRRNPVNLMGYPTPRKRSYQSQARMSSMV
jgi:hypothetical protein